MTVSTITEYGGTVPDPFTQAAGAFSTNAVNWTTYQANTLVSSINTSIGEFNIDFGLVNTAKTDAETAATNAANSEIIALSASNFKTEWSTLTGALNTPASVYHDGAFWQLMTNLADVTASEPSPTNADWQYYSGTRWLPPYTASATLNTNSQNFISATGAASDFTQPTFASGDFIVISNSKASTQTVRLLNPSNTLIFEKGTVSAGDNLVINAGSTIHLYARTSTILEAV